MTISRKESEWAKRIKMWLSAVGISGASLLIGAGVGVTVVESSVVRPYIQKVMRVEYDTLHAPADCKMAAIGCQMDTMVYQVTLLRNIMEITAGDSAFRVAKRRTDALYWRKGF